ncbi:hypothetical protein T03_12626 [Trichinella britovi]|uniref:Uncharacterized protein n=2 Tax=Trichinella TaxID=6333 RepID=A0A0V1A175_TRIBR|nr:hypothetical protein T05_7331 [Trichinella murrelli]KRY18514.1 hypothetical protein T03_12626 [Trichinella britovi]
MFPAYYVFPLSTSVFSGPQINITEFIRVNLTDLA